jgi:hypothetical protein
MKKMMDIFAYIKIKIFCSPKDATIGMKGKPQTRRYCNMGNSGEVTSRAQKEGI